MAEYINPQEESSTTGHFPNTDHTLLEVYRLLAIFLSSKNFADLITNYPGEGFDPIFKMQEGVEDEITRILLNLAIIARVIDDRETRILGSGMYGCGEFQEKIEGATISPLGLREACNKIIHANKIRYDVENVNLSTTYLNPYIYLYGTSHNGKEWKATLDVVKFSKQYASFVSQF